jgi:uncharacterized membrane protein YczE
MSAPLWWRWAQFVIGITCLSFGITLMVRADVGLGPWDVLHQGVSLLSGLAFGTVSIVVGLGIMLFWLPLRERPGPGTVLNIIFVGVLINVFMGYIPVFSDELVPGLLHFPAQVAQMALGVVTAGTGSALYLNAGLGAGPRDGVMMGLVRHTGLSIRLIRTLMEVLVLTIGWLIGGTVGIGTLMFAFGFGPVIQTVLRVLQGWQAQRLRERPV